MSDCPHAKSFGQNIQIPTILNRRNIIEGKVRSHEQFKEEVHLSVGNAQ